MMGTDQHYRNRIVGIGTHDWAFVRKHFAPRRPVKRLTLWLCARGMDGVLMDKKVAGTVWFDDVQLRERGTSTAELTRRKVTLPSPSPAAAAAPSDRQVPPLASPFGAASTPASLRLGALYLYPDERLDVGINLCVSDAVLHRLASCRVIVKHPRGEKRLLDEHRVRQALWTAAQPRPKLLRAGHVDAKNPISLAVDPSDLPVHPFIFTASRSSRRYIGAVPRGS